MSDDIPDTVPPPPNAPTVLPGAAGESLQRYVRYING